MSISSKKPKERFVRNVAVVSLSSGIIGEPFIQFEVEIGLRRLEALGLNVRFMPHTRMGLEYVRNHPEKRAEDLLAAFRDPEMHPYTRKYFETLISTGGIQEITPSDVWYEERHSIVVRPNRHTNALSHQPRL